MKKVLSLVLAVMMVVGMSTVAFAATGELSTDVDVDLDVGVVEPGQRLNVTIDLAGAATVTPGSLDQATGTADAYFSSASADITAANKVNLKLTVASDAIGQDLDSLTLVFEDKAGTANTLTVTLTGDVLYKTVPSGWKITGFSGNGTFAPTSNNIVSGAAGIDKTDELKITADMFDWKDKDGNAVTIGDTVAPNASLRSSHLSNVGVRRVYQKGTSNTIKSVELKDSKSLVEVKTVEYFAKTGSTDVELKLALTYRSKTSDVLEYYYDFKMENDTETIEEGQNEAYSYGHIVQKAEATVRNVEFEGDEDGIVYATKTVVKGQKYYFNVTSEISSADADIIAENPEVDSIYTVYSVNMANATVQFKNLDREFFVYDADGKLLGTTKDSKLPLASKYILTTAKVDFGGEEEPVEEPVEEPTEPEAPPMGGGEVEAPVNNYNPNTGL